MTPAPGPFTPPSGLSSDPTNGNGSALAGLASPSPAPAASTSAASPSQQSLHGQARQTMLAPSATQRPLTVTERTNSPSAVPNMPKLCACCGGLLESQQDSAQQQGQAELAAGAAATAPSPSSVAFAANPTNDVARSTTSGSDYISAMLAGTPVVQEIMQLEQAQVQPRSQQQAQERPQLCNLCTSAQDSRHAAPVSSQPHTATAAPSASGQLAAAAPSPMLDVDGDSVMRQDGDNTAALPVRSTVQQSADVASSFNADTLNAIDEDAPSRTENAAPHPWRRQAPWSNVRRISSSNTAVEDGPPLTISVDNMGAGGDAVAQAQEHAASFTTLDDDADFPPLARSPSSNSQLGTVTSPRLPLSPTRNRSAGQASVTSPQLGRQSSFSRSQSNATMVNAGVQTSHAPVVNVPASTRGRVRTASSGSICGIPPSSSVQQAAGSIRGRRLSATRRLSRSNSSQGPTAVSFAGFGEEGSRTEAAIEENPFGPSSMTRPRLSILSASSLGTEGDKSRETEEQNNTVDVFRKPFAIAQSRNHKDDEKRQQLLWLNCRLPDPRPEISRLRSRSVGRGCLFPGATFRGTQKSGRMSYDVTVQIVNVDLAASHLGGYLNIRGLTDDWPELTTYFDAEIIGQRYGFITDKWGATEADDLKHWGRFTPFRPIRNTLTRPGLRFNHMNKPYVFMRWKERFLVPDHRVRDINGASFAGFYYVCVELGDDCSSTPQSLTSPASPIGSPGAPPTIRRDAMEGVQMDAANAPSSAVAEATTAASGYFGQASDALTSSATSGRMSGFYFHEHSEPYQQLTLRHVPESSSTTFEMR